MNTPSTTTLPNAEFERLAGSLEQAPKPVAKLADTAHQSGLGKVTETVE